MWKIRGYDSFEGAFYDIEGEYPSEEEARQAARKKLQEIETSQPTEDSGGQEDEGIQDRVFIVRPDGTQYRYLPVGTAS